MADIQYSNAKITDDKGNVIKEPKEDKDKPLGRFDWWSEEDDTKMANQIDQTINFMQRHQSARMEQITVSTRLYGNTAAFSLMGSAFTRASSVSPSPSSQRISYNLCSSVIDTLTSQVAKDKIIPTFITSGGKWGMQRKAENLSKFIDGCFYENKVHPKIVEQFNDGGVWGDGLLYVYRGEDDRVKVERCLPHELVVDEVAAMVSEPTEMHRVKICARNVLKYMYRDDEEAVEKIEKAMPANMQDVSGQASAEDLITMTQSWHLPSGPEADDGVCVVCVGDQVLTTKDKRAWDKDYFPFPHFRYKKRKLGFWGQGAVERLQNLQGEINRLMILIQKCMWLGGSFKILVKIGSKVVSQHLNNDVGAIVHYAGDVPPQYVTPPMIQQDIYPYVDALIEKGFRQEGVSMLAASNVKPLGIDSGAALRTYDKIGDDRQLTIGQDIEDVTLETARQMIEVIKDIFKDKKGYKVTWPGTNFVETVDWKDINLEADEYVLKAFPTSSLPEEPMARLETIQEYMQAGLVSPRSGRRLMRTEDIEMSDSLANAAEDLICKSVEAIIYDGDDTIRPDGYWDLQLAKQISLEYYNFAMVNNCPEKNLGLLRDFMGYIDEEMGLTAPPPPPMGAPGAPGQPGPTDLSQAGPPQAVPLPPPQSNLIANVPGAPQ